MDVSAIASLINYSYQSTLQAGQGQAAAFQAAFGQAQEATSLESDLFGSSASGQDLVSFSSQATEQAELFGLNPQSTQQVLAGSGSQTSLASLYGDGTVNGFNVTDPSVAGAFNAYLYTSGQASTTNFFA